MLGGSLSSSSLKLFRYKRPFIRMSVCPSVCTSVQSSGLGKQAFAELSKQEYSRQRWNERSIGEGVQTKPSAVSSIQPVCHTQPSYRNKEEYVNKTVNVIFYENSRHTALGIQPADKMKFLLVSLCVCVCVDESCKTFGGCSVRCHIGLVWNLSLTLHPFKLKCIILLVPRRNYISLLAQLMCVSTDYHTSKNYRH
jgi:hypothetical protein